MKRFSFWTICLLVFLIISFLMVGVYVGLYEKEIDELLWGSMLFSLILAMVFTFLAKWYREYKLTGRWFSKELYDKERIKWWEKPLGILLIMILVIFISGFMTLLYEDEEMRPSLPEEDIEIKDWNPEGYYGYQSIPQLREI